MVLEKTLETPLDCKEIQPVHSKGDQSWVFTGRTDVEAETPVLWPPDAKRWLIRKDLDIGKDWGQEEKRKIEDEMVGSPTQWTWAWVISSCWWWTGRPNVLRFIGSQRVRHDWATELNTIKFVEDKKRFKIFLKSQVHNTEWHSGLGHVLKKPYQVKISPNGRWARWLGKFRSQVAKRNSQKN